MSKEPSPRAARIASGLFLLVAVICFYGSAHLCLQTEHLFKDGVKTRALVTESVERPQKSIDPRVLSYRDESGEECKKRWHFLRDRKLFKIGDEREPTYSPNDPELATLSISRRPAFRYAYVGTFLLGFGVCVIISPHSHSSIHAFALNTAHGSGSF